jgi:hypothetical protein
MQEADRSIVNRVFSNLGKAIAAHERRLLTRRSPFDVYVEGLKSGDPAKLAQALAYRFRIRGLRHVPLPWSTTRSDDSESLIDGHRGRD